MFTRYLPYPFCKCHRKMTFTINVRTFTIILKGGLYNLANPLKSVVSSGFLFVFSWSEMHLSKHFISLVFLAKNIDTIKTLITIAYTDRNYLRYSWFEVSIKQLKICYVFLLS